MKQANLIGKRERVRNGAAVLASLACATLLSACGGGGEMATAPQPAAPQATTAQQHAEAAALNKAMTMARETNANAIRGERPKPHN